METLECKESKSSNSRDWDKLFSLFAKAIAGDNDERAVHAIIKLSKMCKYVPEDILGLTVPMLLKLLASTATELSPLLLEASTYCLKHIASRGEGSLAKLIGESGAITILLRLLPYSQDGFRRVLLKCLRNVVTFWTTNRTILFMHDGLQIVLAMLSSCSDESRLILLEILSALALVREVRKFLWTSRSVHLLVEAASYGSMISRTRAAQAIGLLALNKSTRHLLVDEGVALVLMHLLEEGDSTAKSVAGNSLGVISFHIDYIRPIVQAGGISLYAELLQGSDSIGKEIAEDVLCVLAIYEDNAVVIIEHLVRILRGDDVEAKAAAANVIWDLSSYKYSFPVLQNSGVIEILVGLLDDENVDVKEKVAGAVAQLSQNEADRAVLANCGAIPLLINALEDESDELRDNAAEALVNFSLDPLLGDQISCILENPAFQNMLDRIMQIRSSDEQLNMSLLFYINYGP